VRSFRSDSKDTALFLVRNTLILLEQLTLDTHPLHSRSAFYTKPFIVYISADGILGLKYKVYNEKSKDGWVSPQMHLDSNAPL
jgi:hypothetical protein